MAPTSTVASALTRAASRQVFDRASETFDGAAPVHDESRQRLLQRLELMSVEPRWILDLGCATGRGVSDLAARYGDARVLALDWSVAMLERARERSAEHNTIALLAADAERLPLAAHSVGLVFANLLLPWCAPQAVFREAARVLTAGGLMVFATFGPDTLREVRRAWASVDDHAHVHGFLDMHDVGDTALAAGLADPVMDVDRLAVSYRDTAALVRDLRGCGAANREVRRRRSLTGHHRWQRFAAALEAPGADGRFTVTVELVFGHAWGTARPQTAGTDPQEVRVPLSALSRSRAT
jgi:malonyl-CoA O-methyltransferase